MNETITVANPELWKEKAVAAAVKADKMLWGKHNETIQAWLYEAGLSLATMRDALIGWQVRNTRRPAESWGVSGCEKIHIPEGITIPVIAESELKRLTVFRMGHKHDGDYYTVEGSAPTPLILQGDPRRVALVARELDALLLHQELKKEWTVAATGPLPPASLGETLAEAGEVRILAMKDDAERLAPWAAQAIRTHTIDADSLIALARAGALTETLGSIFG